MIKEIQYTNIKRVLDNLMDHPMLRDINLEQAVRYTLRFIGLHGYPKLYKDKDAIIPIKDYRGMLPCDLESIIQVRDLKSGVCMRSMTDTFNMEGIQEDNCTSSEKEPFDKHLKELYIPHKHVHGELTFKTQGRVIYTSFPQGEIEIRYKSIPVDEDGFPLIIDNENYLAALEAYIKVQVFTIKYDTGKIAAGILQNAQQDYAFRAAELQDEFTVPSISEMETYTRMYNTALMSMKHFDGGFKRLGDREYIRKH
jgi:hypothetical protein